MKAYHEKQLAAIGEYNRNLIWERMCDEFVTMRFRPKQVFPIIEDVLACSPKTAICYWQSLKTFWLTPGNSDLEHLGGNLYGWRK